MGEFAHSSPVGGGALGRHLHGQSWLTTVRVVGGWTVAPATEAREPEEGLHHLVYQKYHVDEIYDRWVVQPVIRGSRFAWKVIDQILIDGIVNGVGQLARGLGWIGSLFATGHVNTYAFVFTLGVLVILGVAIL